ncbi:MAG: hypothetical protein KDA24_08180 [Deltaproteobacteria bacterium]|nr:hypothetical protein [Deltaproteobacteria bacterium]
MTQRRAIDGLLFVLALGFAILVVPDVFDGLETLWSGAGTISGIDLRMRVKEVGGWFAGAPVYRTDANAVYPPAGYLVIGALTGGADFERARALWAVQSVLLLILASVGVMFATRSEGIARRATALLVVPGVAAIAPGVANGQVHLLTVVAGVAGALLLARREGSWATDIAGALLMVICLAKPTNASAFFLAGCLLSGRWRPALLSVGLYGLATVVALTFATETWLVTLSRWVDRAVSGAEYGAYEGGSTNAHTFLVKVGIRQYSTLITVGLLGLFGEWASRRRTADPWVVLGVGGLVARLCVYHRSYDDVLVVPALIALLRLVWGGREDAPAWVRHGAVAVTVVAFVVIGLPERVLPSTQAFEILQTAGWLAMLVFLWAASTHTESNGDHA